MYVCNIFMRSISKRDESRAAGTIVIALNAKSQGGDDMMV